MEESGRHSARDIVAQLLALSVRVAKSRDAFQAATVGRDDLSRPYIDDHRIEADVGAARVPVVDHHAYRPSVLAFTRYRLALVQRGGSRLELDQCVAGLHEAWLEEVEHEALEVLGARAVVERRDLLRAEWRRLTPREEKEHYR